MINRRNASHKEEKMPKESLATKALQAATANKPQIARAEIQNHSLYCHPETAKQLLVELQNLQRHSEDIPTFPSCTIAGIPVKPSPSIMPSTFIVLSYTALAAIEADDIMRGKRPF